MLKLEEIFSDCFLVWSHLSVNSIERLNAWEALKIKAVTFDDYLEIWEEVITGCWDYEDNVHKSERLSGIISSLQKWEENSERAEAWNLLKNKASSLEDNQEIFKSLYQSHFDSLSCQQIMSPFVGVITPEILEMIDVIMKEAKTPMEGYKWIINNHYSGCLSYRTRLKFEEEYKNL